VIPVRETTGGVTFAVKVQPRARKNAVTGKVGEALKLALTAPPLEGRANQALIQFLADFFEIPSASVTIASGAKSKLKRVRVSGVSTAAVQQRLNKILENW
jgi:uncharacterized protein